MADRGMAKQSKGRRIAMWSGPRNISTAMMRSWGNRSDTVCWDEPFYAWYLKHTGLDHPGAEEIIAHDENDWREVAKRISGPVPGDRDIRFLKLMTHQMLPEVGRAWFSDVEHFFLIRDPEMIVRSYTATRDTFVAEELGIALQRGIFEEVSKLIGRVPAVIASEDVLADPRRTLSALCDDMELPFDEDMLHWPAGERPEDGVWARHWYSSVTKSTGFAAPSESPHPLMPEYEDMVPVLRADYEVLLKHKL